jgi:hypothetical protein
MRDELNQIGKAEELEIAPLLRAADQAAAVLGRFKITRDNDWIGAKRWNTHD